MKKVAVLMRTKNSSWVLPQTLASLFSQKEISFKLYIVDSGSTDSTVQISDQYPHTKISMESKEYIPGPVLNNAIEKIDEKIIIMLNSDSVLLQPFSLAELVAPLVNNQEIVATVGRQLPRHDAEPWVKRDYINAFPVQGPLPSYITLSFPLSAFKKVVWQKEKFYEKSWGSEDTEWGKRIIDKKMGLIEYIPSAITMHSHNYNLEEIHNRKFIEGEADYFIYAVKPSLFRSSVGYIKRCAQELIFYLKNKFILKIPYIFIRNFYLHLGHYRGLRSAHYRIKNNIKNLVHKTY